MNSEIIFLDIIGKILLSETDIDLLMLSTEEINRIFDFHIAADYIDLEDDATNRPNVHLFRNKLIIKLVRQFGLLKTIQKADDLMLKMELINQRDNLLAANVTLCKVVLALTLEKLEALYRIIVLEKVSNLLILQDKLKITPQTFKWFFQEDNILDFICARFDDSNQIRIDGQILPFYEIPSSEDEKYQRRVYNRKYTRKEKAYKSIIDHIPLEELDIKIANLKQTLHSLHSNPNLKSIDYGYFYCNALEIFNTLKEEVTSYYHNITSRKVDPNQLSLF